jgi:hypothetical protein
MSMFLISLMSLKTLNISGKNEKLHFILLVLSGKISKIVELDKLDLILKK